ncbi:cysteine desulfurase NifS, partial [Enterococcus hirae]
AVADALREARGRVARLFGARRADEVTVTSGGTESIQTAFAAAAAHAGARRWVVTSTVEHSATKAAARDLEARGFRVRAVVAAGGSGLPGPEDFGA